MPETSQVYVNHFRCPDERSARQLVNTLQVAGLYPDLDEPAGPGQAWAVVALTEVESEDGLGQLQEDMRAAAQRAGAAFEGTRPEEV